MEALDAIERRIDQLNRIVGSLPDEQSSNAENLTDSLISANTLISSAMSGRPKISDIVNRSAELERILDPAFLDDKQDTKAKEVYVNTVAPELAASFEQLEKIKKLEPALGAEYFRSIPDVSGQLQALTEVSAELVQNNDLQEDNLTIALQRYDEVQSGINQSLLALNSRIDQLEERLRQSNLKKKSAAAAAAAAEQADDG